MSTSGSNKFERSGVTSNEKLFLKSEPVRMILRTIYYYTFVGESLKAIEAQAACASIAPCG
jgi:hypothetical protein